MMQALTRLPSRCQQAPYLNFKSLIIAEASAVALQNEEKLMGNSMLVGIGAMIGSEDLYAKCEGYSTVRQGIKDQG